MEDNYNNQNQLVVGGEGQYQLSNNGINYPAMQIEEGEGAKKEK